MRNTLRPLSLVLLSSVLLALSACARPGPFEPVRDLRTMPQDPAAYLPLSVMAQPLDQRYGLDLGSDTGLAQDFLQRHFDPWRRSQPAHASEDLFWGLKMLDRQAIFGENLLPKDQAWRDAMRALAAPENVHAAGWQAIATANTSLRTLPSLRPVFYDPRDPGEGFPFDMLQNSAVWAGTPLYVAHLSADRAWALVETRFAAGWMPVADLARVDQAFMDRFQSSSLAAITHDDTPLVDESGLYRFQGRVGMLLPCQSGPMGVQRLFLPVRQWDGTALLIPAFPPRALGPSMNAPASAPFPLALTPANLAALARTMMGQAYGWGGLYMDRDCSATIMDLFAGFGIYLPRNSSAQAKAWRFVSFEGMSDADKQRAVLEQGRPLLTLLRKPGHIMLYLGPWQGRPAILHTAWGLRTDSDEFPTGRKLLGSTVITSLTPGQEHPDVVWPKGSLLHGLTGMTFVGERP